MTLRDDLRGRFPTVLTAPNGRPLWCLGPDTVEDLADGDYASYAYVDTRSFADDPDLTNNVAGPETYEVTPE